MNKLTNSPFFHLLKANNQHLPTLEQEFEQFAVLLFSGNTCSDKEAYCNMLIFTRVKLSGITEGLGKKMRQPFFQKPLPLSTCNFVRSKAS